MHARVRIARVYAIISYTSAYRCTAPYPGQNEFLVFEGSFLEAPRAVLFHATAIHCHCGIDIEDASFLVLERVTDLPPIQSSIQPEKIEKWTSEELSRSCFQTLPYKTLYQTQTPPLHMTYFSRFDQSEATFEMSCGIIPSELNYHEEGTQDEELIAIV